MVVHFIGSLIVHITLNIVEFGAPTLIIFHDHTGMCLLHE